MVSGVGFRAGSWLLKLMSCHKFYRGVLIDERHLQEAFMLNAN